MAREQKITLREGIYAMVGGPQYETPAEVRWLKNAGADVVGKSASQSHKIQFTTISNAFRHVCGARDDRCTTL